MKLQDFLEITRNKWVKIKNNDTTIIQNVKNFVKTASPTVFECTGQSVSNAEGEVLELNNFYTTKFHQSGFVTELSESEAQQEIQAMKG